MQRAVDIKHNDKCCVICKYWRGNAVFDYNPIMGRARYEGTVIAECTYFKSEKQAASSCNFF